MHYKEPSRPRRYVKMLDPACAICSRPPSHSCDCEQNRLQSAIKEAERKIMKPIYAQITAWVRRQAQDYILNYFHILCEKRKIAHAAHIENLHMQAHHRYGAPPHPRAISEANQQHQQGINEDWQASVQRYPEVLAYFYSIVELELPADDEPAVRNPPLGGGAKKQRQQIRQPASPRQITQAPYQHQSPHYHPPGPGSRTPEPQGRRPAVYRQPSFHREREPYYA